MEFDKDGVYSWHEAFWNKYSHFDFMVFDLFVMRLIDIEAVKALLRGDNTLPVHRDMSK